MKSIMLFILCFSSLNSLANNKSWKTVEEVLLGRTFYCRDGSYVNPGEGFFAETVAKNATVEFQIEEQEGKNLIAEISAQRDLWGQNYNQTSKIHFRSLEQSGRLLFILHDQRVVYPAGLEGYDQYARNIKKTIRIFRNNTKNNLVTNIKISKKSWKLEGEPGPDTFENEVICAVNIPQTYP